MPQCPRCSNKVADDALFCTFCGMKMKIEVKSQPKKATVIDRNYTLNILKEKCGFSFEEDKLSTSTEKEIGSLTNTYKGIEQLNIQVPILRKKVRNARDFYSIVRIIGFFSLLIGILYFLYSAFSGIEYVLSVAPYFITFLSFGIITLIIAVVINKSIYEPRYVKHAEASETYNELRKKEKMLSENICQELIELHEQKKSFQKAKLDIGFSNILHAIEEVSNVVQNYKCEKCGASVTIPNNGNAVRCNYCGAIVKATDVLTKVKDIINLKE